MSVWLDICVTTPANYLIGFVHRDTRLAVGTARSAWNIGPTTLDSSGGITVTDTHKHDLQFASGFPLILSDNHFSSELDVPENHHDYLEVSLIERGQGYLRVGEIAFPIADGDVILMGPEQLHTVEIPRRSELFVRSVYFLSGLVFSPGEPDSNLEWLRPFYDQRFRCDPVIRSKEGVAPIDASWGRRNTCWRTPGNGAETVTETR